MRHDAPPTRPWRWALLLLAVVVGRAGAGARAAAADGPGLGQAQPRGGLRRAGGVRGARLAPPARRATGRAVGTAGLWRRHRAAAAAGAEPFGRMERPGRRRHRHRPGRDAGLAGCTGATARQAERRAQGSLQDLRGCRPPAAARAPRQGESGDIHARRRGDRARAADLRPAPPPVGPPRQPLPARRAARRHRPGRCARRAPQCAQHGVRRMRVDVPRRRPRRRCARWARPSSSTASPP